MGHLRVLVYTRVVCKTRGQLLCHLIEMVRNYSNVIILFNRFFTTVEKYRYLISVMLSISFYYYNNKQYPYRPLKTDIGGFLAWTLIFATEQLTRISAVYGSYHWIWCLQRSSLCWSSPHCAFVVASSSLHSRTLPPMPWSLFHQHYYLNPPLLLMNWCLC